MTWADALEDDAVCGGDTVLASLTGVAVGDVPFETLAGIAMLELVALSR